MMIFFNEMVMSAEAIASLFLDALIQISSSYSYDLDPSGVASYSC